MTEDLKFIEEYVSHLEMLLEMYTAYIIDLEKHVPDEYKKKF